MNEDEKIDEKVEHLAKVHIHWFKNTIRVLMEEEYEQGRVDAIKELKKKK